MIINADVLPTLVWGFFRKVVTELARGRDSIIFGANTVSELLNVK